MIFLLLELDIRRTLAGPGILGIGGKVLESNLSDAYQENCAYKAVALPSNQNAIVFESHHAKTCPYRLVYLFIHKMLFTFIDSLKALVQAIKG